MSLFISTLVHMRADGHFCTFFWPQLSVQIISLMELNEIRDEYKNLIIAISMLRMISFTNGLWWYMEKVYDLKLRSFFASFYSPCKLVTVSTLIYLMMSSLFVVFLQIQKNGFRYNICFLWLYSFLCSKLLLTIKKTFISFIKYSSGWQKKLWFFSSFTHTNGVSPFLLILRSQTKKTNDDWAVFDENFNWDWFDFRSTLNSVWNVTGALFMRLFINGIR